MSGDYFVFLFAIVGLLYVSGKVLAAISAFKLFIVRLKNNLKYAPDTDRGISLLGDRIRKIEYELHELNKSKKK